MKRLVSIIITLFVLMVLIITNPNQSDYQNYIQGRMNGALNSQGFGGGLVAMFAGGIINTAIQDNTKTTNLLFFSIYDTTVAGIHLKTIGALHNFMIIGKSGSLGNLTVNGGTSSAGVDKTTSTDNGNTPLNNYTSSDSTEGTSSGASSSNDGTLVVNLTPEEQNQQSVIASKGYTGGNFVSVDDGNGGTLYAWAATLSGNTDGSIQWVFFFDNSNYLGTDTSKPHADTVSVTSTGTGVITVEYAVFNKSDPMCCPSGTPFSVTYQWSSSKLVAQEPFQNQFLNQ